MRVQPMATPRPIIEAYPEIANLYPLIIHPIPDTLYKTTRVKEGRTREDIFLYTELASEPVEPTPALMRRALQRAIRSSLKKHTGYSLDRRYENVRPKDINYAPVRGLQICPSFDFQVLCFSSNYYLCLNYRLISRAVLSMERLLNLDHAIVFEDNQKVVFKFEDNWSDGRLNEINGGQCSIRLPSGDNVVAGPQNVVPILTRQQSQVVAPLLGANSNELERLVRQHSLLNASKAPLARFSMCTQFANSLAQSIFPIVEGNLEVGINPNPAVLRPPQFSLVKDISEPRIAFDHVDQSKRSLDVINGLTNMGTYDKPTAPIRLLVMATSDCSARMDTLVQRLNGGSGTYKGARKTFGREFAIAHSISCGSIRHYQDAIREFVRGRANDDIDVALVHVPMEDHADGVTHPYYQVKAQFLREGIASQMVGRQTIMNPAYRDLNLALNIFAKAGHTPWVLNEAMPNVDLFIGLSYSQVGRGNNITRMMSYVNIFDSFGRWRLYQGDTEAFLFDERLTHYREVISSSIASYKAENGGEVDRVHIHLTKKFSFSERSVITQAVRDVSPNANVTFVSVNTHHNLRMADIGNDGHIARATYLSADPTRIYIATTGSNVFNQKGMGTPVPLELTVWADPEISMPSMHDIAQHMVSLTRLNWASTRNFCHEPITTKYAGDIAKLMSVFMKMPNFTVNARLRGRPWFL